MTPNFETGDIQIYHGDAREVLSGLDVEATACVTDPPYGLAFMGRSWDDFEPREYQDWCMECGEIVMDSLLPGAPVLAFSGTRTAHRLTCGLEDAGLVIRDRLAWMYGSGFPKSHDISKAIDDAKDADREDLGPNPNAVGRSYNKTGGNYGNDHEEDRAEQDRITAPATDEAERWDGYGTALAPSHEPVILAMKPKEKTFAHNAQKHGVAGLSIDAARVETDDEVSLDYERGTEMRNVSPTEKGDHVSYETHEQGRWPANVVLDEVAAEGLDASRYFYTSKASSSDRNAGLPDGRENDWPTVKPTDLMGWLLRLVEMPSDNLILDPFAGSGTTAYVAQQMGLPCVAIDQSEEACELTKERLSTPSLFS